MKSNLKITNLSFIKETHSQEEKNIKGGGAGDIFAQRGVPEPFIVNPDAKPVDQFGYTDALGLFTFGTEPLSNDTFPDATGASPTIL